MRIKIVVSLSAVIACASFAAGAEAVSDPTRPSDAMADVLKRRATETENLRLHALVAGLGTNGVALVGKTPREAALVRAGSRLQESVDGVRVEVAVRAVTAAGVEFETAAGGERIFLPGAYAPLAAPSNAANEFIRHLECEKVPLGRLLRLVADQTGVNISTSDATADKTVSIFLRNVTAESAVEEICRTSGLWFRRDPERRVIRVTTMAEYAESLQTFREETMEAFTLLYPNVVEVAAAIYGLYPDRTLLSLGEEEFMEDAEYDLSQRFRRFRVLEENGNSTFMEMQAPRSSSSSGRSGAGNFSFGRGNAISRLTQWDQLRSRRHFDGAFTSKDLISPGEASQLDAALAKGNTNLYEYAKSQTAVAAANIFVSMSRKNNMLMVRTSDVRVMDEIRKLVKRMDVPTPMVLMEVKILELDITDDYEASFRWTLRETANGLDDGISTSRLGHKQKDADGNALANLIAKSLRSSQSAIDPTFTFALVSDYVRADIDLMQKDGKVKTLATPTLLVANNEVSRIFSGKEYPIVTGWSKPESQTTQGLHTTTEATVEIERKDIGTMLLITPNINADKTVTLRLLQENSSLAPDKVSIPVTGGTGEEKEIDYVESRSLAGTFVAKDNMLVMAGGLIKETEAETYWRTPILGSIPYFGWLFRGTQKEKRRTELVVLIKPHVILTPVEGGKLSNEVMKALSAHPAADGRDSLGVFNDGEGPARDHTISDDIRNIVK